MGRSGRVAPRICSTLEIRTHPPTSSMALTLPPPPSSTTTVVAAAAPAPAPAPLIKTTTVSCSPLPPPPLSPYTPGQTLPPASVKPRQQQQAWPLALLQLMQQQLVMLNSHNDDDDGGSTGGGGGCTKRKHCCAAAADHHDQEGLPQDPYEAGAVAAGNDVEPDVELHAQSPLPDEWEQFLDLRVRDARLPISKNCCCF